MKDSKEKQKPAFDNYEEVSYNEMASESKNTVEDLDGEDHQAQEKRLGDLLKKKPSSNKKNSTPDKSYLELQNETDRRFSINSAANPLKEVNETEDIIPPVHDGMIKVNSGGLDTSSVPLETQLADRASPQGQYYDKGTAKKMLDNTEVTDCMFEEVHDSIDTVDISASGSLSAREYSTSNSSIEHDGSKRTPAMMHGYSIKSSMPVLKLNVPLAITTSEIFEVFTNVSRKEKFQIIEMEQTIATAVNKEPFSLKKIFMKCFPFGEKQDDGVGENPISAVRLQISVSDSTGKRKITLKGLYGDIELMKQFVSNFRTKMHAHVKNCPQNKANRQRKSMNGHSSRSSAASFHTQAGQDDSDEDSELRVGKYTETSSVYQLNKILSSDQYTLGKNIQTYLESFHMQYRNLKESASMLPQPMEGIAMVVNETVNSFNSEYNLGKAVGKDLLHYCRPTVERYLFTKLYDKLFAMYAIKNEKEDKLFNTRGAVIKQKDPIEVMEYLGINKKFFIKNFEEEKTMEIKESVFEEQLDSNQQKAPLNRSDMPYIDAIREIEKIQSFSSPCDMVGCLSNAFQCLKTAVVDHHKGKFELSAMDDVLPLTIYIVSMSELSHPSAQRNMMEDYLRLVDRGFDLERKLLCNFDCAVKYTANDWELEI